MAASRCSQRPSSALQHILSTSRPHNGSLPAFLVPAFTSQPRPSRFSTTAPTRSKIGRAPLSLPPEVSFTITQAAPSHGLGGSHVPRTQQGQQGSQVEITGPKGTMKLAIPPYMSIVDNAENKTKTLSVSNADNKAQREMWGTIRAYLQNHILGVSEGHTAILRLVGVGYRATIEPTALTKQPTYPGQKFVSLKVGYSHPIELGLPEGVTASTPQPTRILLEGVEKEVVMQFAAEIRAWRKPEPYKGKGIFVNDETIKLKAKKIK
ncbi:54S ribosomal protein L6 mitochondrial [Friedmanniomyces endolithicus]|nr:54S ribosomal protein L6 mitochondrial [Friedmanniomyces endolithicus]KAK0286849.1 54S ribosomal protein L6 mitochondrial [Friedmanniomyces endolithicus]KAK1017545.1 54S ribosomal protein L6 mitochondrial [Friedmanniomyces endolithicus]